MLVLKRRLNETLIIGRASEITIKILAVNFGEVKLGIEAPKDIPIMRQEAKEWKWTPKTKE